MLFHPWNMFGAVCVQYPIWLFSVITSISCFLGMLLRYFLNDYEMVQVATVSAGITSVLTFHTRYIFNVRSLYFTHFSSSFIITFLSPGVATSISLQVPFLLPCIYCLRDSTRSTHCATSQKVAGSISDDIEIFHRHNPSGRTTTLGSTQPLTEMSTRNSSWHRRPVSRVDNHTVFMCRLSCNLGASTLRACPGLYTDCFTYRYQGVQRPWREADHSPASSEEVKK